MPLFHQTLDELATDHSGGSEDEDLHRSKSFVQECRS
jgi:hypothetical protein